jgi:hypothetical protein
LQVDRTAQSLQNTALTPAKQLGKLMTILLRLTLSLKPSPRKLVSAVMLVLHLATLVAHAFLKPGSHRKTVPPRQHARGVVELGVRLHVQRMPKSQTLAFTHQPVCVHSLRTSALVHAKDLGQLWTIMFLLEL